MQDENIEEAKANPVPKEPVNHYKEMGLESSQIVLKNIAASLGFSLTKRGRGATKAGSRGTSTGAGKSGGGSGKTTGLARKRTLAASKGGNGMDFASMHAAKQFIVQERLTQPVLRYIPNRDLI